MAQKNTAKMGKINVKRVISKRPPKPTMAGSKTKPLAKDRAWMAGDKSKAR